MLPRVKSSPSSLYSEGSDWRAAISTPLTYRIGSSSLHFRSHLVLLCLVVAAALLTLLYLSVTGRKRSDATLSDLHRDHGHVDHLASGSRGEYNSTYPLTKPLHLRRERLTRYRVALVEDPDTASRVAGEDVWRSHLKYGHLELADDWSSASLSWDTGVVTLESGLSSGGRGMELSELVVFNGKLYTLDDRTGVVYEVKESRVVPWVILGDGGGGVTKGLKGEWATVREERLWVGGLGKEWTTPQGEVLSHDPMWVKTIDRGGQVEHIDWVQQYQAVRAKAGIQWPGYMIHEAVCWSSVLGRWVFLPRRASKERYNDVTDERLGSNLMILADSKFKDLSVSTVGTLLPTHGFSSFKFVPGTNQHIILALKSEEFEGNIATYVTVFDIIGGKVLYPETKIGDFKYEGVEFV